MISSKKVYIPPKMDHHTVGSLVKVRKMVQASLLSKINLNIRVSLEMINFMELGKSEITKKSTIMKVNLKIT